MGVRIFRLKGFARFQRRERIADAALLKAAWDVSAGRMPISVVG